MGRVIDKKTIVMSFIFIILIGAIIVGGYILSDKLIEEDYGSVDEEVYEEYKVGDKVVVNVNDNLKKEFYVLKDSSSDDEMITLFADRNIGYSAFNNDSVDGNNYENSLIKSKLEDITKSWDNVLEKRLITVEEIKDTGLTTDVPAVMFDGSTVINTQVSGWLINEQELYWTMSKGELTEQYVYVVMNGMLQGHIVGYAPGSQWNLDGTFFSNFGIRPVIVISKEYVK